MSQFQQYFATGAGDLADFLVLVHRHPSFAAQVEKLRFQLPLDGMVQSGIYGMMLNDISFQSLKNSSFDLSRLPTLSPTLECIRDDLLMALFTYENQDDIDLSFYLLLVGTCFASVCSNINAIEIPPEWRDDFPQNIFPSVPGIWVGYQPNSNAEENVNGIKSIESGYGTDEDEDRMNDNEGWMNMGDEEKGGMIDEDWEMGSDSDSDQDSDWNMPGVEGHFDEA